jgi:hypothetical protein
MKPWTKRLARLGIVGICIMAMGCGGGVPDPGSDEQAASESSPPPESGGGAPAPPPRLQVAKGPAAPAPKAVEEAAEETPAPAADEEKAAAQPKSEGSSATAEMLAMASNSAPGGTTQPGTGATPATAPGTPPGAMGGGMPGRPGGPGGPGGMGGPGGPGGMGGAMMRSGSMIGSGGSSPNPSQMDNMNAMRQAQARQGGPAGGGPGMPGRPGGPGGPGGGGADNKPANFTRPFGAVEAFLSAVKAKDQDRILEASALRASVEPPEKNKALFKKIFEMSLSDSELDDLANMMEGYTIAGENPPKSTGKVEVVLQKSSDDGSRHTMLITVRREGKGWGILLLGKPTLFKSTGQTPRRSTGTGGNR